MMIGQLAASSGVPVRTLRFYADAGVLPEAARTASGYRVFGPDAVARARLVRTLRELGVGLDDITRVLAAEASLVDVAADPPAALRAFARSAEPEETDDATPDQVAAWLEIAELLRDADFVATSRRMAQRPGRRATNPTRRRRRGARAGR